MKKKHLILCLLSAALFLLGIHPLEWYWFAWFGFLPLFLIFLDRNGPPASPAVAVFITGFLYYGVGLYWLLYYQIWIYFACLVLIAPVFALYFALLKFLTARFTSISFKIISFCFLWLGLQKIYALSPVGTIGTDALFYGPLPFFQTAAVTGFSALSALIMGLNASLAFTIKTKSKAPRLWCLFFLFSLLGIYFWGQNQLKAQYSGGHRFAVVQHNLPVSGKWRLDHALYIRDTYRKLALEAAKGKPQLILFPLYSFPEDALRNPEFFTGLARETNTYLLVATYIPEQAGGSIMNGFFDMAILYSPEGKVVDSYTATQRPPFRDVSELTEAEYKVMPTPFGKLGILLCYEDSLPWLSRKAVRQGADFLIALSNPGHFSSTHMPYYHLIQDRLRAIESSRFVVRASSNGYSALVDPRGKFLKKSRLNHEELIEMTAGKNQGVTLYQRYGDILGMVSLFFALGLLIIRITPLKK